MRRHFLCLVGMLLLTACPENPEGKPCRNDGACGDGYVCDVKKLIILNGVGRCQPIVEIGDTCALNKQCKEPSTGCYDKVCRASNEGAPCKGYDDCYFEQARCAASAPGQPLTCMTKENVPERFCAQANACKAGFYCLNDAGKDYGFCVEQTASGQACQSSASCQMPAQCVEGQDGQKRCVSALDQPCLMTNECEAPLICRNDRCAQRSPQPMDMTPDASPEDMPKDASSMDMDANDMLMDLSEADMNRDLFVGDATRD